MSKRPTGGTNLAIRGVGSLLFDEKPFEIDGFRFRARSVEAIGRPSIDQWQGAYQFAEACGLASEYWIGDLLTYVDSRADWAERLEQIKAVTGLAHQTLLNRTWLAKHVGVEERAIAPSVSHANIVAPMAPAQQRVWLEKASVEGWTVGDLRNEVRASQRRKVVQGQAVLEGMFRVIYADPPWKYRDSNATADGSGGKAERHYPPMAIDELCKLPVKEHAHKNSVLFMWVTTPMIFDSPGPADVMRAWGFEPKSMQTWDKVLGMPGRFFQITTEHLVVGERGACPPDNPTPKPKSLFTERRTSEHSAKPGVTRKMIEKLYDTGPFLELFGREPVKGWSVFGNDAKLWSEQQGGK